MIVYTDKRRVPFLIDDADYEAVSRYNWLINSQGYPETMAGKWPKLRHLRLHRFLLGPAPDGLEWDHKDRDKLNNRRSNLRAVTDAVNQHNRGISRHNTSGVNGVSWDKERGRWFASIYVNNVQKNLGRYDTMDAAIAARREAENRLWADKPTAPQATS